MKTCTVLNACNLSPLDRATTLLDGAQEENEWFRETGDPSLLLSPTPVDPPLSPDSPQSFLTKLIMDETYRTKRYEFSTEER